MRLPAHAAMLAAGSGARRFNSVLDCSVGWTRALLWVLVQSAFPHVSFGVFSCLLRVVHCLRIAACSCSPRFGIRRAEVVTHIVVFSKEIWGRTPVMQSDSNKEPPKS